MRLTPQHIPFERLADLVEGRLGAEKRAQAEAHLTTCARCAGQADELRRVTGLMRADTSSDAPRDVVARVLGMLPASRAAGEPEPGLLRRIVASLTFDSSSLTPAFGVRSGQAAPARQLLFGAGDFDVDLRLAEGEDGWTVSGQILGPCEGGGRVEMSGAGGRVEDGLNDLCEFTLSPVPAGSYALRLRVGDVEVEVPELSLQA
ncbi:MAG TPA: zf-HC2 domain-containing protein [Pyrinomonadaceae bacterium]|nr:zf-HC2 domain-containing protein [Pyrinomonadaceae bacterium]